MHKIGGSREEFLKCLKMSSIKFSKSMRKYFNSSTLFTYFCDNSFELFEKVSLELVVLANLKISDPYAD